MKNILKFDDFINEIKLEGVEFYGSFSSNRKTNPKSIITNIDLSNGSLKATFTKFKHSQKTSGNTNYFTEFEGVIFSNGTISIEEIKKIIASSIATQLKKNNVFYLGGINLNVNNPLNEKEEQKELWYVQKTDKSILNISTSQRDAQNFLEKSLKNDGNVYYISVPLKDWELEKVNTDYIKSIVRKNKK